MLDCFRARRDTVAGALWPCVARGGQRRGINRAAHDGEFYTVVRMRTTDTEFRECESLNGNVNRRDFTGIYGTQKRRPVEERVPGAGGFSKVPGCRHTAFSSPPVLFIRPNRFCAGSRD